MIKRFGKFICVDDKKLVGRLKSFFLGIFTGLALFVGVNAQSVQVLNLNKETSIVLADTSFSYQNFRGIILDLLVSQDLSGAKNKLVQAMNNMDVSNKDVFDQLNNYVLFIDGIQSKGVDFLVTDKASELIMLYYESSIHFSDEILFEFFYILCSFDEDFLRDYILKKIFENFEIIEVYSTTLRKNISVNEEGLAEIVEKEPGTIIISFTQYVNKIDSKLFKALVFLRRDMNIHVIRLDNTRN